MPIEQSPYRHMPPFRSYVDVNVSPLEHHFEFYWKKHESSWAWFAVARDPHTGRFKIREEAMLGGMALPPRSTPTLPAELEPMVAAIREAAGDALPPPSIAVQVGYLGQYRVVDFLETMPLGPVGTTPRVALFEHVTLKTDEGMSTFSTSSVPTLGRGVLALCFDGQCPCDQKRWAEGLPAGKIGKVNALSTRDASQAELRTRLLDTARAVAAGRPSASLDELLAADPDRGRLPSALDQQIQLAITVVGRPIQPDDSSGRPKETRLTFSAKKSIFGSDRASTSVIIDGIPIGISASLSADGPPKERGEGEADMRFVLLVRFEDPRGRISEHRYHAHGSVMVDGDNGAFLEWSVTIDELVAENWGNFLQYHTLPGTPRMSKIDAYVGSSLQPIW